MRQEPYTPMENNRLEWVSSAGTPEGIAEDLSTKKGKLALILLVGASDSEDCCAKNFERTVFRDEKVVKYARQNLVPHRYERDGGLGAQLYEKFKLDAKKPAVLILDGDAALLYKTQKCTQPRDCANGMITAAQVSLKKAAYSSRAEKTLSAIDELVKGKNYGEALSKLDGLNRKLLLAPLQKKVESRHATLEALATKQLALAARHEKRKEFQQASDLYKEVSRSFSRLPKVKSQAAEGLRRLQKIEKKALETARQS